MAGMLAAMSVPQALRAQNGALLPVRGANLVEMPDAPFGGTIASKSLRRLAATGANWVAIIPFFWQSGPQDTHLVPGDALPPERLRAGIRQAHEAGLTVLVKPHVWVPETWAGAIAMQSEQDWSEWFVRYQQALLPVAEIAQAEGARALSIGTELRGASGRDEWAQLIAATREKFSGQLTYVTQGADEASHYRYWHLLDVLAPSLYPELGAPGDKRSWHRAMAGELARLRTMAAEYRKPLWLAEVGIRSARDASWRPWESAEERAAEVDLALQADVVASWLEQGQSYGVQGIFVWRWFSDPAAGGPADTDFTVQNKPAEQVLRDAWSRT